MVVSSQVEGRAELNSAMPVHARQRSSFAPISGFGIEKGFQTLWSESPFPVHMPLVAGSCYLSSERHMERYSLMYPPPKNTQCPAIGYSCHSVVRSCHPAFSGCTLW